STDTVQPLLQPCPFQNIKGFGRTRLWEVNFKGEIPVFNPNPH
ncbi:MAG: hypothetical protein EZS28_033328, partial [Streblomastix strix]